MTIENEMSAPVTRQELKEELAALEARLDQKLDQKLDEKLDQKFAERDVLFDQRLQKFEERVHADIGHAVRTSTTALRDELHDRIAQMFDTFERSILDAMAKMFEPFKSLPATVAALEAQNLNVRVMRLENKVFAPRKRQRATAARRKRS